MGCMSGSETLTDSEASACNKVVGSAATEAVTADLLEMVGVTGIEFEPKAVDGRRKSWARAVLQEGMWRACQSAAGIVPSPTYSCRDPRTYAHSREDHARPEPCQHGSLAREMVSCGRTGIRNHLGLKRPDTIVQSLHVGCTRRNLSKPSWATRVRVAVPSSTFAGLEAERRAVGVESLVPRSGPCEEEQFRIGS